MIDQVPPHDPDSEQGLIGCVLLDSREVIPEVESFCRDVPGLFYTNRHKAIYAACKALHDAGHVADVITATKWLKERSGGDYGGIDLELFEWMDKAPVPLNWSYHAQQLKDRATRRRWLRLCNEGQKIAGDLNADIDEGIAAIGQQLIDLDQNSGEEPDSMLDLVGGAITDFERAFHTRGQISGVASGFYKLDRMTGGFEAGQMIVIAARPSAGKTSLAMTIATHQAVKLGGPVGVFSLEMSKSELVKRTLCGLAGVSLRTVKQGAMTEGDQKRMVTASAKLAKSPMIIDDKGGLNIPQLSARARRMVHRHKVKLIVVDYLQLMKSANPRANRYETVTEVSNGIKQVAKSLKIPVIALAQLNREVDKADREPQLSDLRDSGSIEQDADIVAMLHSTDPADSEVKAVNLLIRKHRNGPTGNVELVFNRTTTTFTDPARRLDD